MSHVKLNLAPPETRESKLWFLGDAIIIFVAFILSYSYYELEIEKIRNKISAVNQEISVLIANTKKLEKNVKRYEELKKEEDFLLSKIEAVKEITVSKIARFKPVILLELLQILKPEGVWFTSYNDNSSGSSINITGKATDYLIVSEFIATLRATENQPVDPNDLRSQIYFSNIYLKKVNIENASSNLQAQNNPNMKRLQIDQRLLKGGESATDLFPEIKKSPSFSMNIIYSERSDQSSSPFDN